MSRKVALISYSYRLPNPTDESLWECLLAGRDLVTKVPESRWSQDFFFHPDSKHPGTSYSFAAGTIGDISRFDAAFFGISPREAASMDPQQRIMLELTWEAMENAGLPPGTLRGSRTHVILGASSADYSYRFADDPASIDSPTATGNAVSILANRLSYYYDLKGPSLVIDTACSSSLVAFHLASQAILSGQAEVAITGGISLHLHPQGFLVFSKAGMLSKTGRCHVFDEAADGYVRSEGAGIFILKDYQLALADGDPILAIVAGSATNTDGHKSSMPVPCAKSQARLIEEACQAAGIHADDIDYFETHGTGTQVGDPIETEAIGMAIGSKRNKPLPIGSVKSNLGHLEAAAGVAGLVKSLLSLNNRCIPPSIGFNKPNPNIKFTDWKLKVVTDAEPLPETGELTIGINSFGFGGANAHVILQSAPEQKQVPAAFCRPAKPLPLFISAHSAETLKQNAKALSQCLHENKEVPLYDLAYSSRFHRQQLRFAALVEANSVVSAIDRLNWFAEQGEESDCAEQGVYLQKHLHRPYGPVFVYPGNGCQWQKMGQKLIEDNSVFKRAVEDIDHFFMPLAGYSLVAELAGGNGPNRFVLTEFAQPALFALQVGITRLLKGEGITPGAVVGHSVGEITAAWASGALSLQDAVKVIYYRSLHQGKTRGKGQMTAVAAAEENLIKLLEEARFASISLAGINSPRGCTLSGPSNALEVFEKELSNRAIPFKRLDLDYAFHSPIMDEIRAGLLKDLSSLKPRSEKIPFISTVTGEQIDGQTLNADYWWRNIRKPVLFNRAVDSLCGKQFNLYVEIGGHPILQNYLTDILQSRDLEGTVIPTIRREANTAEQITATARKIVLAGYEDSLSQWFPVPGRFVALPNYVWQNEHHWVPTTPEATGLLHRHYVHPLLGYPLAQHQNTWEVLLDTERIPWLKDHQVGDSVVYPGAGFTEAVCAAANLVTSNEIIEVEELEIISPLLLNEHKKVVRTTLDLSSGKLTIKSRNQNLDSNWTDNLKARIVKEPTGKSLQQPQLKRPDRAPDFTAQEHANITRRAGLNYGPAFSAIRHGWADHECAIAELKLQETCLTDAESFILHPTLLDCAFQMICHLLQAKELAHSGIAYVPVRIERLHVAANKNQPTYATARITTKAPYSLTAEFTLYDDSHAAIVHLTGVRFKAIRTKKLSQNKLSYLDYHLTPVPRELDSKNVNIEGQVKVSLLQALELWLKDEHHRHFVAEVEPLLDGLSSAYMRDAFTLLAHRSGEILATELGKYSRDENPCDTMLNQLLANGVNQGDLKQTETGWQLTYAGQEEISAEIIWNTLIREYPAYLQPILSVGRHGQHLMQTLSGPKQSTILEGPEALYGKQVTAIQKQGFASLLANQLGQAIKHCQSALTEGQRLGIVELAHNGPLLAESICSGIDFHLCDYGFASSSESALESAAGLQRQHPEMRVHPLGETLPPSRMTTLQANSCQLAIVNLDFLDRTALKAALSGLRNYLAANAVIVFLGLNKANWLSFMLNTSRQEYPVEQISLAEVVQLAEEAQLQPCEGFSTRDIAATGPYLFMAEAKPSSCEEQPREINRERLKWLLVCSEQEEEQQLAHELAEGLTAAHQSVQTLSITSPATLKAQLAQTADLYDQYENIVVIAGLAQNDRPESSLLRCEFAANTIQFCEACENPQKLWILTNGMTRMFPCDQELQESCLASENQNPEDAALWGYARTAMNEVGRTAIKLIDLPHELTPACTEALFAELLSPSSEDELCLTCKGSRYAPRLRYEAAPEVVPPDTDTEETAATLSFQSPGQLHNLLWTPRRLTQPAADELEIEVLATGLNFRDVMYTLGLLSDEALENGFAGASLGLEFSGRVRRTGSRLSDFKVGDMVVGFGSASFSSHLLTRADAVTRIPEHIDPVAAASIPTAFFTAYYALHHCAQLQAKQKVLIHGAAGGVGIAAIQVAQWLGAEVYATAGTEEKRDFLKLLGVKNIYDSRSLVFAEEILADSPDGEGVDVVLNSLAGEAMQRNFRVLKPFGRFLEIGKRDFYENSEIGLRPFRNNISYFGIDADQIRLKLPDLANRLFRELMQLFQQGELHPLPYTSFSARNVEEAFRYMQHSRQIGKIVVSGYDELDLPRQVSQAENRQEYRFSKDATYLVTGGLSGLGLSLARWLAERGAGHLLLVSRRGRIEAEDQQSLLEIEALGTVVHTQSCDVSNRASLQELISLCKKELPPLKGVIHAAASIDDGLIVNQTGQQLAAGMNAKINGARFLHELTMDLNLDLFVLLSSATTLFGNPGQSAYVAANLWMEALAAHRRNLQLPVTCVRFSAVGDVGFLARNPEIKKSLQKRMGGTALNSKTVVEVIEKMLLCDCRSTLACMELDWATLRRTLPCSTTNKFSEISAAYHDLSMAHGPQMNLQEKLAELTAEELHLELVQFLTEELSQILLISENKIDPNRSLYEIGLDSLMGVELSTVLEEKLEISLPVMLLSENPSLNKLSQHIIQSLTGDTEEQSSQAARQVEQAASQHGIDREIATPEAIETLLGEQVGVPKPEKIIKH